MTFQNQSHTSRSRGFTLIELLTVIAIIGILAAILIPTVGKVRDSAKASVCASNMRQISIAMLMFADDNNGVLPTIADGGAAPTDWIHWRDDGEYHQLENSAIVPYLGGQRGAGFSPDIYRCPADENIRDGLDNPIGGWVPYKYSYSMNIMLDANRNGAGQLGGRLELIRDQTRIIMLAEEARPNNDGAHLGGDVDGLTRRHSDKGHVTFADAHVELVHPEFAAHESNWNPNYKGRPYTGPR